MHLYTKEQAAFIAKNVKGRGRKELTTLFNTHFGLELKHAQIIAYLKNHELTCGVSGCFEKGHVPFNKGRKGVTQGGVATQFKKGQRSHNYKPVGSERVDREGYVLVKVSDKGAWHERWRHKQRVLWEKEKGPVPKGHILLFLDSNKQNITLANLILVLRGQLAILNKNGLIKNDADLTRTGIILADIYKKIGERKK